jgi:hypothetical protein
MLPGASVRETDEEGGPPGHRNSEEPGVDTEPVSGCCQNMLARELRPCISLHSDDGVDVEVPLQLDNERRALETQATTCAGRFDRIYKDKPSVIL